MVDLQKERQMWDFNSCGVIVADPDDETLWADGNNTGGSVELCLVSRGKGSVGHVV